METKAVRLYGKEDIRLEEFELAPLKDNEILVKNITDSICMSSYKAAKQGADHVRVPNDVAENPIILGHEICGEIVEVGKDWQEKYNVGDKFVVQPGHNKNGSLAEPVSTVIGGFNSLYHHKEKIKGGSNLAMIASVGPMGLVAIAFL